MTQNAIIESLVIRNIDANNIVILRVSGQSVLSPAHEKLNSPQKGTGERAWSNFKGLWIHREEHRHVCLHSGPKADRRTSWHSTLYVSQL